MVNTIEGNQIQNKLIDAGALHSFDKAVKVLGAMQKTDIFRHPTHQGWCQRRRAIFAHGESTFVFTDTLNGWGEIEIQRAGSSKAFSIPENIKDYSYVS